MNAHPTDPSVPYDLVLKAGHVIDPKGGTSAIMDVAVADGRIAALGPALPIRRAQKVVDVSGYYVTPGLIDMHVHVAPSFDISLVPDAHSLSYGVTTLVDAGSTGPANLAPFIEQVVRESQVRILAFLNVVDEGMGGEYEQDVSHMMPEQAAEVAAAFPDLVVGIKVAHYWTWQPWDADHAPWDNVERGVRAGELSGLPVMVDFWPRPPERTYADLILEKLRPGDIHTHVFAQQFPIILEGGRLNPILGEARRRGIIFDVGHGAASFWFRNAAPALRQGFVPDSISTDMHLGSVNGLAGHLLLTMTKFLNMGLSLEQVVERVTVAPAREIGHPELGTLAVGSEADVAVLERREGEFGLVDCGRARLDATEWLDCALTLRSGRIVYDRYGLSMPRWEEAPSPYWVCKSPMPARARAFRQAAKGSER